jgi:hypothetical protein
VFAIVSTRISKESLSKCHVLYQGRINEEVTEEVDLISADVPSTRVVAVVDRSANVSEAASIIGVSRTAFNGQSDYSPALVLVNEFVADEFLFHLTQVIISPVREEKATSTSSRHSKETRDDLNQLQSELSRDKNLKLVISGENGSILEIRDR